MAKALTDMLDTRRGLATIWGLYLIPRALLCLIGITPTSDADWYFKRAAGLAQGLGYLSIHGTPTAYWPPGWPMALSTVFRMTGPGLAGLALLNLACGALTAWLVLDLGRRLFSSELAARLGLLLLALYPNNIGYFPLALTEVFYTALLLSGCWLLIARPNLLGLIAGGVVFGMATLVKAQTLIVVPLIVAIGLLRGKGWLRRVPAAALQTAAVLGVAAMVVCPWSARNQQQLGQWVAVSTNGGITLLTGNNGTADGSFSEADPVVRRLNASGLGELAYDAEAKRLGLEWIKAHPGRFLSLMPRKLLGLWGPDGEAQWAYETGFASYPRYARLIQAARIVNQLYYFAMLAGFALAAVVILRRRWRAQQRLIDWWMLPYGIAAYPSAIAMVFSGQSRFHYPVMPFVAIMCGWLLADWLTRKPLT